MKYIHIQNNDQFVEPYINFVNKNFNPEDHQFVVIRTISNKKFKKRYRNVKYYKHNIFKLLPLIKKMNQSEFIFIHGLFIPEIILLLFLQPWLLKKCYWIVWGGDLYAYNRTRNTLNDKAKELLRAIVIKRFGHIVTLVEDDYKLAKKWYSVKGKYHHGAYINPISIKHLDSLYKNNEAQNDNLIIQVGNSANPTNNHIEALKELKRFREENITIYAPLSYAGDESYVENVIEVGKKIFGDKFKPLTNFLPPDEYSAYLKNIDIAIFNNNRQQALGNIYALLYLNKKVYIRSDTTMWSHFEDRFGIKMNDFLEIKNMTFRQLKDKKNIQSKFKITPVFTDEYYINVWQSIFNDSEGTE